MKLTIIAALLVTNISAVQIESHATVGRRIHRSQLVSIAEALADTSTKTGDDSESPAELKKPVDAKSEEEEVKAVVKESKNDLNEREDKSALVKPTTEKEEEPEKAVEEKAPAAGKKGKGKNATKKAEAITDTHDRKNPIKRIREWTKAYEGQTIDVDEHYPLDTTRYGNKNFDEPKESTNST